MICFHFTIFEPLETVERIQTVLQKLLWFAFILVSLNHWKQLGCSPTKTWRSCDLLSFCYLWTIGNSFFLFIVDIRFVVICFHFSIFEPLETVLSSEWTAFTKLWFAFILVSLNHWKQSIADYLNANALLWFAFILVSLNHWKQCSGDVFMKKPRCDLLSFYYLWTIGNSIGYNNIIYILVVICFHFHIFEPLETVEETRYIRFIKLWFAFILVSLNHWKQYIPNTNVGISSCDLLSF